MAVFLGSILVLFASLLIVQVSPPAARAKPGAPRKKSMAVEILGTIWLTSLLILLAGGWIMWVQSYAFAG